MAKISKLTVKDLNIVNVSPDTINIDDKGYEAQVSSVKKAMTEVNESLKRIKKEYKTILSHSKSKGKVKKNAEKIVNGCNSKIKKNKAVKNNLETSLLKSVIAYKQSVEGKIGENFSADTVGTGSGTSTTGTTGGSTTGTDTTGTTTTENQKTDTTENQKTDTTQTTTTTTTTAKKKFKAFDFSKVSSGTANSNASTTASTTTTSSTSTKTVGAGGVTKDTRLSGLLKNL